MIRIFSSRYRRSSSNDSLGNHLQNLEAEKHKLRTQVKRLCQENAWLRDELASSQKKLHDSEQSNATYSVELDHLKFLKRLNNTMLMTINPHQTIIHHQQMHLRSNK